ncbi:GH23779 [Drosophila grimshawi]|uniref:GH23779 n=1 Tax=Drosophila grimshawi TaxID=7222 RepID=B4K3Z7_DROGR|nr:GH23779 [Drosophila grimshawi]
MTPAQATIINGVQPQAVHRDLGLEPPADRLVVFLSDRLEHKVIFGGFNKNASAALTSFKWNPTVFDTVLNRTRDSLVLVHIQSNVMEI